MWLSCFFSDFSPASAAARSTPILERVLKDLPVMMGLGSGEKTKNHQ
jgi:hypothetical protein